MAKLEIGLQKYSMKNFHNNVIIFNILFSFCFSQDFFQNSKDFKFLKYNSEKYFNFSKYNIIGDPRINDVLPLDSKHHNFLPKKDSNNVYRVGLRTIDNDFSIYLNKLSFFTKYLYFFLDARLVSNTSRFENFSGLPRKIKRFGFESGEISQGGIGFQNDLFILQYGRGKQNWGSGNGIELAISNQSHSYDQLVFEVRKNNFKYRYFHGFLENINNINRYLLGKGIEYSNHENLRLGISEIVIYSGENRSLDLNYLNPISSHLEIEMNGKGNLPGSDLGNAIWQISFDSKLNHNFRLMSNFLIDELTIDKSERDRNKAHGLGLSVKLIFSPKQPKNFYFALSYTALGTKTFRHRNLDDNGYNNFVYLNDPIGWAHGSDSQKFEFQINHKVSSKFLNNFLIYYLEAGQESILENGYDPYDDYLKSDFPSGKKEKIFLIKNDFEYYISNNFSLKTRFTHSINKSKRNDDITLMIDYYFNLNK